MTRKKLYKVYYSPTAEVWYYLDKKLAEKTRKALVAHEKEHYGTKNAELNVEIEVCDISDRVVFQ